MTRVAAILAGWLWLSAALADDHAVVLIYHHVSAETPAATSVTPAVFERHLDFLERNGFTVWPLTRVLEAVEAREELPRNTVAITFDDAYRSVYSEAFPRLRKRGWPFTVFVNTEAIDRGFASQMDWAQLRDLRRAGVELGNHTHTHDHLVRRRAGESDSQWRQRVRRDIETAGERLAAETGARNRLFAYPYGEYSAEVKAIVRELGYFGIAQQSGAVGYLSDPLALPRFPLARGYDDLDRFATAVNARPLPVVEAVATGSGGATDTPGRLQLTLADGDYRASQIACYSASGNALPIETSAQQPRQLAVDLAGVGRPGRNKVNCTAPAAGERGAFFWYSYQWLMRRADGSWYRE